MRRLIAIFALFLGLLGAGAWWWLNQSLAMTTETVDLSVEPGTSARGIAQAVSEAGVQVDPSWLYWWFRLSGKDRLIKAGSYELVSVDCDAMQTHAGVAAQD